MSSTGKWLARFLIFAGVKRVAGTNPSTLSGSSAINPFSIILTTLP